MFDIKSQYDNYVNNISRKFNDEIKRYKTSKSEDDKKRLRTLAQNGFSVALKLKTEYEKMAEVASGRDKEECLQRIKYFDKEMDRWLRWLQKLGSTISGIPDTTFDDIAGLEDVKETVRDYLFMLRNPEVASTYRINTNLGILLYGPPGTGKTLIAEAIAHELNVRYFVITPSQIFGSYVGESEQNVRDIFEELRACEEGSVLLIDECESIFARREGDSNRAALGVANQLLQEMNGQADSPNSRRVILGATNRPELIDEAYLRYKRFSLQFYIGMPNEDAKRRVVELNIDGSGKKKPRPYEPSFKDELMLRLKNDNMYTCADISGIIEQCAYMAMSECRTRLQSSGRDEFTESDVYVPMASRHLRSVLARYPRSVTQDMLDQYEAFRDSRR